MASPVYGHAHWSLPFLCFSRDWEDSYRPRGRHFDYLSKHSPGMSSEGAEFPVTAPSCCCCCCCGGGGERCWSLFDVHGLPGRVRGAEEPVCFPGHRGRQEPTGR